MTVRRQVIFASMLLMLLAIVMSSQVSASAPLVTVMVEVTDACSAMPLVAALVTLLGNNTYLSSGTDGNGQTHFESMPLGNYQLIVSAFGYLTKNTEVLVATNEFYAYSLTPSNGCEPTTSTTSTPATFNLGVIVADACTGLPITAAQVTLLRGDLTLSASTDGLGKAAFYQVPVGNYEIMISIFNYETIFDSISISTSTFYSYRLQPTNPVTCQTVTAQSNTVTAHTESTSSTSTITPQLATVQVITSREQHVSSVGQICVTYQNVVCLSNGETMNLPYGQYEITASSNLPFRAWITFGSITVHRSTDSQTIMIVNGNGTIAADFDGTTPTPEFQDSSMLIVTLSIIFAFMFVLRKRKSHSATGS